MKGWLLKFRQSYSGLAREKTSFLKLKMASLADTFRLEDNEELDTAKVRILLEKVNEFYCRLERVKQEHFGTAARKCRLVWIMEAYLRALEEMCDPLDSTEISEGGKIISIPAGVSLPDMPPMQILPMMVGLTVPERTPAPVAKVIHYGKASQRIVITPTGTPVAKFLLKMHSDRRGIVLKKGVYELKEMVFRRGVLIRQRPDVMIYIRGFIDLEIEPKDINAMENEIAFLNDG